ncbi:hypothetical protein [Virgibacillus sediminis]|uniref:Uncharacterized protein n=1 Tax=Virgibacillus sediminis TaxID=202260 RepID=A0ABV7A6H4_9BACI
MKKHEIAGCTDYCRGDIGMEVICNGEVGKVLITTRAGLDYWYLI